MELTTTQRRSMLAVALFAAGALSLALVAPAHAAATESSQTQDLYLQADDAQIDFTAPVAVEFGVDPSGAFQTPDNGSISNDSVFSIYVSKIGVAAKNGATLKTVSAATGADEIGVTITPGSGTAVEIADYTTAAAPAVGTDWNMARDGQTGDSISLAYAGQIGEFGSIDPSSKVNFAQITWYVKAGAAS